MITPVYAALLAFVLITLSVRVLLLRRRKKIAVGDGDDVELLRAMRAQANFIEYVPFTILLLYFCEVMALNPNLLHGLCFVLLAGRIIHGLGLSRVDEDFRLRVFGMACTFTVLLSASLSVLWISL